MSETLKLADECKKLLDNGWRIRLWKNSLGSYTAAAVPEDFDDNSEIPEDCITDDFEPSQALYRLTEKVLLKRIV